MWALEGGGDQMIQQLDGNSIYKCGALLKLLFLVPYLHAIQTKVGLSKIVKRRYWKNFMHLAGPYA